MSDNKPAVEDEQVISEDQAAPAASKTEQEQSQVAQQFTRAGSPTQLSMKVRVHSPFRNYYDGIAYSLTAESATGPFDILPHHHNFISLLLPCVLVIRTVREGEKRIQISGGIIHVKADQVTVFLDI